MSHKNPFSYKKGVKMRKHWICVFQLHGVNSCISILKKFDISFKRKSNICNFSRTSARNHTSFWEFNVNFSFLQWELPTVIVQEHEENYNVMGYHKYRKTHVSIVRETLQCQMELENITNSCAVAVIRKGKVVRHFMNGKSRKHVKSLFFPRELIPSTEEKCKS